MHFLLQDENDSKFAVMTNSFRKGAPLTVTKILESSSFQKTVFAPRGWSFYFFS